MNAIGYKNLIGIIALDLRVSGLVEAESNGYEQTAELIISTLKNRGLIHVEDDGDVTFGHTYYDYQDEGYQEINDRPCSECGQVDGHLRGCFHDTNPFNELLERGFD